MRRVISTCLSLLVGLGLGGCLPSSPPPPANPTPVPREVFQVAANRLAAVVVSSSNDVEAWFDGDLQDSGSPQDADGGSAAPVAPDGYFLTADHVVSSSAGRNIFVVTRAGGQLRATRARVVWSGPSGDLALLHAPVETPDFYRFTPPEQWVPEGTPVMHSGISTGFRSSPGRLVTGVPPESGFSSSRSFKHDIPLRPGDSGGAVIDARGLLVGVNSAVEFLVPLETAFFIESEANRPNVGDLMQTIEKDRERRRR